MEGAEVCPHCGESLTLVGTVIARQGTGGPPSWLAAARSTAAALKAEDEQASHQRLGALWDVDRRRIQAEAEAEARRREQDRQILTWGAAASAAILLLFIVLAAAALLR